LVFKLLKARALPWCVVPAAIFVGYLILNWRNRFLQVSPATTDSEIDDLIFFTTGISEFLILPLIFLLVVTALVLLNFGDLRPFQSLSRFLLTLPSTWTALRKSGSSVTECGRMMLLALFRRSGRITSPPTWQQLSAIFQNRAVSWTLLWLLCLSTGWACVSLATPTVRTLRHSASGLAAADGKVLGSDFQSLILHGYPISVLTSGLFFLSSLFLFLWLVLNQPEFVKRKFALVLPAMYLGGWLFFCVPPLVGFNFACKEVPRIRFIEPQAEQTTHASVCGAFLLNDNDLYLVAENQGVDVLLLLPELRRFLRIRKEQMPPYYVEGKYNMFRQLLVN
jgi:hypothetical protein